MRIDLHTHSTVSDGTDTPAEVMAAAREAGLDAVALTDHDTTLGWPAAADAAQEHRLLLIPGMEISCIHAGVSIHLLSYLHDPQDEALLRRLRRARTSRDTRARRMVDALAVDLPIRWDDVAARVHAGATIGRPHIADALVEAGIVADRGEAFARYLHSRSGYYAAYEAINVMEAVRLVRAAGGVPVMAHPFAAARGPIVDEEVIEQMARAGLAGLEAHHRDHDRRQEQRALAAADGLGLFVTGSSDYHGSGKPNRLGERMTKPEVLEEILAQGRGSAPMGFRR